MARTTRAAAAKANENLKSKSSHLSSPPATPVVKGKKSAKATPAIKKETPATPTQLSTPASNRKRTRKTIKQEDQGDVNELPHNLAVLPTPESDEVDEAPAKKRAKRSAEADDDSEIAAKIEDVAESPEKKQTPKKKTTKYKLNPGISPYPNYPRPTPEECHEVVRILEKLHGKVNVPKVVPPPSLEVAGCGEVPSVLDALIRTRLSANTTNKNSSTAFQGLVKRFGTLKEGVGKGSVDWDAVRTASNHDVFKAIERGGLAKIKSKDIQSILQIAYEENQERKAALTGSAEDPAGAEHAQESEKQDEIEKAEQNVISLDHMHLLSRDDAIRKMVEFPGIGLKTASCVALFCMGHASFAVDTHVFRLCQYLGWVPKSTKKGEPKVDRDTTFSHCDVRIPDELKYALHQLLIKHGKTCPRCRAATGQSSANWEEGCPIEHLVKRHGAKKGGVSVKDRKKAEVAATGEEEVAKDESELSDVASEFADE
ncbi:unnamed protein product [Zymoseptoria tritici ST99CH_1E4]|uniref:HhH-GPD domain-containing protein n=1 Tax=Zymoseptoria tritici ST99CH_1E4 TaxID=1276532 RepID=A0A2H1GC40_ZYMTR|nr:unnamed protein product [Zymoseptoria tritici ST99CH_1E4]